MIPRWQMYLWLSLAGVALGFWLSILIDQAVALPVGEQRMRWVSTCAQHRPLADCWKDSFVIYSFEFKQGGLP